MKKFTEACVYKGLQFLLALLHSYPIRPTNLCKSMENMERYESMKNLTKSGEDAVGVGTMSDGELVDDQLSIDLHDEAALPSRGSARPKPAARARAKNAALTARRSRSRSGGCGAAASAAGSDDVLGLACLEPSAIVKSM